MLGRDYAGTVESLGSGVDGFTVGERVAGVISGVGLGPVGTLGELFTQSASLVARVPSAVSSVEAAALDQTAAALGDFGSGKLGKIVVTVR